MTRSTSGRTPSSKRRNGQVGVGQGPHASLRESKSSQDRNPTQRISPELADLLAGQEARLIMEADNVGLEQLIAALNRIPIRRRKP
jgi:hypothetical protein